jgi:cell division protein FtsW (lipid II flippase)
MPLSRSSFVRRAAAVFGVALCVAAGIAIYALVTGHLDATGGRTLASTFMAALCALTALAGATLLERADARRWLGLATIALSATEFALAVAVIWTDAVSIDAANEGLLQALGATSVLLPAFVHAGLMLGRLRPGDGRLIRGLTAAALGLSMLPAVLVAGGLALAVGSPGAGAWRLLGVDLVLAILSTLLVPIVRRLARASGECAQPESAEREPARSGPNRITMFRRSLLVHRSHAA